jgi:putative toxin-antitoxin system antitoxin component (TIGR02293 family)
MANRRKKDRPALTLFAYLAQTLGRPVQSDRDLLTLVEQRLPPQTVEALTSVGLSDAEVYRLVLPRRTLTHRLARREPLTQTESDRVVRVARITGLAQKVFADSAAALRWLRKPQRQFGGRRPLELLSTEVGARLVEEKLYQIDHGMAA